MRILFDTNVLLDILIARSDPQWSVDAARALSSARALHLVPCISVITIPTLAYVIKNVTPQEKKRRILTLTKGLRILPSTEEHVRNSLKSRFRDIEDALQFFCAKENGCDLIITRDIRDFKESDIPVLSPRQFLAEIS